MVTLEHMKPRRRIHLWPALALLAAVIAAACAGGAAEERPIHTPSPTPTATPGGTPTPTPSVTPSPAPPPTPTPAPTPPPTLPPAPAPTGLPQATEPPPAAGIDLLTPVSKQHGLPASYVPPDLTPVPTTWTVPGFPTQYLRYDGLQALGDMLNSARAAGLDIRVRSAYRSYDTQAQTFAYWVSVLGEHEARRVSAPPGHSEHQLGTAVDFTSASAGWALTQAFGATAEGQWLKTNAPSFGFALSYPETKEAITGYVYEPWHWRYIGRDAAQEWAASGLTLIEYLLARN
jgi:zinc D-Ala-D-Ala carboxypeptidase